MNSPLDSIALFHLGPFSITQRVLTTGEIMLILVLGAGVLTRHLDLIPGKRLWS